MMTRRGAVVLAAVALAGGPAGADIVRLANGNTLEGVVRDGDDGETLVLETRIGTCRIRRAQVLAVEAKPVAPPAATREPAPPTTPPAAGTEDELSLFGEDGALLPPCDVPESVVGRAAGGAPAARLRPGGDGGQSPPTPAEAEARGRLDGQPVTARIDGAVRALRSPDPALRRSAALALRDTKDPSAVPPLARRAMGEADGGVLKAVAASLGALGDPEGWATRYFAGRLASGDRATRARAAEVLGWTGDARWLPLLVRRYTMLWGSTNRGYCLLSSQSSYVPDYDIELAAGVAIPDPKVGVVQDGVVLDAKVLKVEEEGGWYERAVVHDALVRLAGVDAGRRPEDWVRWWNARAAEEAKRTIEKALQAAARRMADPAAETRARGHREALETVECHRLPPQVKAWADAFKAASDRHWTAVVAEVESRRVVLDLRVQQVDLQGFRRLPVGGPVNAVLELPVVTRVGYQGTVVVPAGGRR